MYLDPVAERGGDARGIRRDVLPQPVFQGRGQRPALRLHRLRRRALQQAAAVRGDRPRDPRGAARRRPPAPLAGGRLRLRLLPRRRLRGGLRRHRPRVQSSTPSSACAASTPSPSWPDRWRRRRCRPASLDAVVMFDVIEHLRDPFAALDRLRDAVVENGLLVLSTMDSESVVSRLIGSRLEDFRRTREHLFFFSRETLRPNPARAGLRGASRSVRSDTRSISPSCSSG